MIQLPNYLNGQWQALTDGHHTLLDPVTGEHIAITGGAAANLEQGFNYARRDGASALQSMTFAERAAVLTQIVNVLKTHRDDYYAISLRNSGTTKSDSAIDIEGALFTLSY